MRQAASAQVTRRMLAALAGALTIGAIVATVPPRLSLLAAVVIAALTFVLAVAVAVALLAAPAGIRSLVWGRLASPPAWWLAIALAIGAVIVFPVNDAYNIEQDLAASGGEVGYCDGVLPLGELVQNRLAGERYAALYYVAGCQD